LLKKWGGGLKLLKKRLMIFERSLRRVELERRVETDVFEVDLPVLQNMHPVKRYLPNFKINSLIYKAISYTKLLLIL